MKSVIEPKLEQVIYESDQTIVYRGIDDNAGPVIIKAAQKEFLLYMRLLDIKMSGRLFKSFLVPMLLKGLILRLLVTLFN